MIEIARCLWLTSEHSPAVLPSILLSAAFPRDVELWRRKNPWSAAIPLVLFGDHTMAPAGRGFMHPTFPGVPYLVENVPEGVWSYPVPYDHTENFSKAVKAYAGFAAYVAERLPIGPAWVVGADADGGVLAVAVAKARGYSLALAAAPASLIGVNMALDMGVDLIQDLDNANH